MTLIAIAAPSFAIGLLLGPWEARSREARDRTLWPHQAAALVYEDRQP